jgi:antitoxin YefM
VKFDFLGGFTMDAISYTQARSSLSAVMARVTENHEPLIITSRKGKAAVLMALEDYEAWQETFYLTRSLANKMDLLNAVKEIAEHRNLIERELIVA